MPSARRSEVENKRYASESAEKPKLNEEAKVQSTPDLNQAARNVKSPTSTSTQAKKKSRNDGKGTLYYNATNDANSAGQSTTSIYKQEQVRQKLIERAAEMTSQGE